MSVLRCSSVCSRKAEHERIPRKKRFYARQALGSLKPIIEHRTSIRTGVSDGKRTGSDVSSRGLTNEFAKNLYTLLKEMDMVKQKRIFLIKYPS